MVSAFSTRHWARVIPEESMADFERCLERPERASIGGFDACCGGFSELFWRVYKGL